MKNEMKKKNINKRNKLLNSKTDDDNGLEIM